LATAAPIVFAVLWVANPTVLFANATTSLASTFTPPDETGTQALSPAGRQAPSRQEVAAALRTAFQSQTEARRQPAAALLTQFQTWAAAEQTNDGVAAAPNQTEAGQPSAAVLLMQFQTWAAEEDSRTQAAPVQPEDAGAQAVQNTRAQLRPIQKHRRVHPVQNARAEIRPAHETQVRREPNARVQDRSVQNVQTTWPLRRFSWLD
jgi:hypothetical protein